jgi:hypothetical protein
MPLDIEVTLNIIWIPLACILSALLGFIFRSAQINKLKRQNLKLERQCLNSDAEILSLYREIAQIREELKNSSVPVIPINAKEGTDKAPDTSTRKKLLGTSSAQKPS